MNPQTPITLNITLERANLILESLAAQPFARVADAINELRMQVMMQIAKTEAGNQQPAEPKGD